MASNPNDITVSNIRTITIDVAVSIMKLQMPQSDTTFNNDLLLNADMNAGEIVTIPGYYPPAQRSHPRQWPQLRPHEDRVAAPDEGQRFLFPLLRFQDFHTSAGQYPHKPLPCVLHLFRVLKAAAGQDGCRACLPTVMVPFRAGIARGFRRSFRPSFGRLQRA